MSNIYTSGKYLDANQTWHAEDSPWKAEQIIRMITKNGIHPTTVAEIGCGAGVVLGELSKIDYLASAQFMGYDISPQAIELCRRLQNSRVLFAREDLLSATNREYFDILLAIDVIEHVPDYMGFLGKCRAKAKYKIYHIPLDIHVSSVLRNVFIDGRYSVGHLHYFTAESAIATLKDTGHEIIDSTFTNAAFGLFKQHPSIQRALANVPRWLLSKFSVAFTARLLGGYSLLVLAK
jgi:SAM-dependent methyltransferase